MSDPARKVCTLDVDGEVRLEVKTDLDSIYNILGRGCDMFQELPCPEQPFHVWLDEEGKLRNLPVNPVATAFLKGRNCIFQEDFIVGKVMFVGEVDQDGEVTDIDPSAVDEIKSFAVRHLASSEPL